MQTLWHHTEGYAKKGDESSPWEGFVKDRYELSELILEKAQCWVDYLSALDEDAELPKLSFVSSSGNQYTDQDSGLILLHIFNHATHHRGQVTAGVTNLGYPPIDGLDYVYFLRIDKQ
ncbi:hypothetical protein Unana1_04374 [Umbelopsis nana]